MVFYNGVWAISKVALTSPMNRQVDPINMLRDMRHGVSIGSYWPLPRIIFLCLFNFCMGVATWRMVLSGITISLWWFTYHFEEEYCKAISPALTITCLGVLVVLFSYPDVRRGYEADFRQEGQ